MKRGGGGGKVERILGNTKRKGRVEGRRRTGEC